MSRPFRGQFDQDIASWDLRLPEHVWANVVSHLDPGDGAEHGGALLCGVANLGGGSQALVAREFIPAQDGVDYVPGTTGHRALTPSFIRRVTKAAAAHGLAYLALHNHGRGSAVAFSPTDLASHERGYPALLDLLDGRPVGALVVATPGARHTGAVCGDVWLPDGTSSALRRTVIIGNNILHLFDAPPSAPPAAPRHQDRSSRLLGAAGLAAIGQARIGVVGCGGAGIVAIEHLARLDVGHLVGIDPDAVDPTNLPRMPGARRLDALGWLRAADRPEVMRRVADRLARPKVKLAARLVRRASRHTKFTAVQRDVTSAQAVVLLKNCDYIVLAADSQRARHFVNAVVHQYGIPAVQVGVKAQLDDAGTLQDLFAVARVVLPGRGCLWCSGLVDPAQLSIELLPDADRHAAQYGTGDAAPAVITLNGIAVSVATTQLMLAIAGRHATRDALGLRLHPAHGRVRLTEPVVGRPDCPECVGRLGKGDALPLPGQ